LQGVFRLNRYRLIVEQRHELEILHTELLISYDKTIEGWSQALDLRDKETEGHTQRVTDMTVDLARSSGMDEQNLQHIWRGALLHDMGKLGMPDSILLKPGKLTDDEWVVMRQHPVYAYQWLKSISFLQQALDIPYCHHEKWDGTGYPRGLKGEEIPLAARLFAIVDVWDALCSDRPYRAAVSEVEVRQYLLDQSGKHFDPVVVRLFFEYLDGRKTKEI
jgi:putative two-component system response regulator